MSLFETFSSCVSFLVCWFGRMNYIQNKLFSSKWSLHAAIAQSPLTNCCDALFHRSSGLFLLLSNKTSKSKKKFLAHWKTPVWKILFYQMNFFLIHDKSCSALSNKISWCIHLTNSLWWKFVFKNKKLPKKNSFSLQVQLILQILVHD